MNTFQERVRTEKLQLDQRLEALSLFITGPMFAALPMDEQDRMHTQRHLMCALSGVLGARIASFKEIDDGNL